MAQKFILFENIISGSAIKANKQLMTELEKLGDYVFGESDYLIEDTHAKGEDLQSWSNDELYKAITNDYCKQDGTRRRYIYFVG